MADEFTTSAFIPALPMAVYLAWLDGAKHSEMTGADAHIEPRAGAPFDSWDGYIHGTTVELDPGRRILQRWRTAEFPGDAPDSTIELTLAPEGNGTRLKIKHSGIPEGQGKLYESGWQDHYFRPMQEYFIHAGISGVPHGASVTEILHRVSTGQASPSSPSLPVFRDPTPPDGKLGIHETDDVADAPEPAQVVEEHEPTGNTDFELADDNEEDDFDTSKADKSETSTDDFWKHLETPAKEAPAAPGPVVEAKHETPGRRPARRAPAGAGKPAKSSGRRAGLKPAARPNKKPVAAKKTPPSPGRKAGGSKKKPATKKKPVAKKKPATKKKPKKAVARKKPPKKAAKKAVKKPAKKKAAAKQKPKAKKKKK